jgi:putative membrane protein
MDKYSDPRVLFAAERTLLAWNRSSLSLIAMGFVIERFGFLLQLAEHHSIKPLQRELSFLIGISLILWASGMAFVAIRSHYCVLKNFDKEQLPPGYNTTMSMLTSAVIGCLGLFVTFYLTRSLI